MQKPFVQNSFHQINLFLDCNESISLRFRIKLQSDRSYEIKSNFDETNPF